MLTEAPLPELVFRSFLNYQQVVDLAAALEAARPGLCHVGSLGQSHGGREIPLLIVTDYASGTPEDKPGYLVFANIHASEMGGTHAAFYTARQLLEDNTSSNLLQRVAFYIVPRLNPDGAEEVVTTSTWFTRSRTDRSHLEANTLYPRDMNGDGLILAMRQEHRDGSFIADPEDARLLIWRTPDAAGPFYRVLPEGEIHQWDGTDHLLLDGRSFDWNRNWSYSWRPEPEQAGAGDYPYSEPEMRHLAEFIAHHRNLFGILSYHNGINGVLRPPSSGSEDEIEGGDLYTLQKLAQLAAEHTGLTAYAVSKIHAKGARDGHLWGHSLSTAYFQWGLFMFEIELGLMMNSAGVTTEEYLELAHAEKGSPYPPTAVRRLMRWWDSQPVETRDPLFEAWEPYQHPQLGPVEIGGFLRRHQGGPSFADLAALVKGTYAFTVDHARKCPRVELEDLRVDAVAAGVFRIRVRVANRGEFPTHISNRGRGLRRFPPVRVEFQAAEGVTLLSAQGHYTLGHLAGLVGSQSLEWFVSAHQGAGELCELRVLGGTGGNLRRWVQTSV
jgi:hypothetical protein